MAGRIVLFRGAGRPISVLSWWRSAQWRTGCCGRRVMWRKELRDGRIIHNAAGVHLTRQKTCDHGADPEGRGTTAREGRDRPGGGSAPRPSDAPRGVFAKKKETARVFMVPDREACCRDGFVGRMVGGGTARGCGEDDLTGSGESGGVYSPTGRTVPGRGVGQGVVCRRRSGVGHICAFGSERRGEGGEDAPVTVLPERLIAGDVTFRHRVDIRRAGMVGESAPPDCVVLRAAGAVGPPGGIPSAERHSSFVPSVAAGRAGLVAQSVEEEPLADPVCWIGAMSKLLPTRYGRVTWSDCGRARASGRALTSALGGRRRVACVPAM